MTIEVKSLTVHGFSSDGIGSVSAVLTLRKPMKLSFKSEKAREQLLKKLPKLKTHLFKYHSFVVEYGAANINGTYRFLFNKIEG
jgi:hypothetical protein